MSKNIFSCFWAGGGGGGGGGQGKPAWIACPLGKISRDILPPGGQAVQGARYTVTPVVHSGNSAHYGPFR